MYLVHSCVKGSFYIYLQRIADHDAFSQFRSAGAEGVFKDGPVGFECIGFFGGDHLLEESSEVGGLQFVVLYFFEAVGDQV